MALLARVATCNLNQWALDFEGNYARVVASIDRARAQGATFRTGPELELTGYSCEDSFLENETIHMAWESVRRLLAEGHTQAMVVDVGMPVMHRSVRYNARVLLVNGRVVGVRPKLLLANDGNYREMRYFTPWWFDATESGYGPLQEFALPPTIARETGQQTVPIGIFALVDELGVSVGFETCEELFTPASPGIAMALDGVDMIANGSGSHHQLRKLDKRIDLVRGATSKAGGAYLYANQKGCDGGRLYFDGCAMVWVNGELIAQGSQFGSLGDVEVVVANVDISGVRSFRSNFIARSFQASSASSIPRIRVDGVRLGTPTTGPAHTPPFLELTVAREPKLHSAVEEIALGPSAWLWDYLRRSGMRGFFLPLSGGADSSATATLVAIMCQRVVADATDHPEVLSDVRRVTRDPDYVPTDSRELCGRLLYTCYMASKFSGGETRQRAAQLADEIGATHSALSIDGVTDAVEKAFQALEVAPQGPLRSMRNTPRMQGGSTTENLALQNIQARSRMVLSYFMAQLLPWSTASDPQAPAGSLLVLGSANVDEALRGYFTKYDCSAADLNPIGGINKRDLKDFLRWAAAARGFPVLERVAGAEPSAELTGAEGAQRDEDDMGMSYAELADLGYCRKVQHLGPFETYLALRLKWKGRALTPSIRATGDAAPRTFEAEVSQKVKDFFFFHAINRHKMTTLTPSYHAEDYSPDDNRFDLRPFLQPARFERQCQMIDEHMVRLRAGGLAASKS